MSRQSAALSSEHAMPPEYSTCNVYLTCNSLKVQNSAENGERSVLTLGSAENGEQRVLTQDSHPAMWGIQRDKKN